MKNKQGLFHLLTIFFVPGILVSAFLVKDFVLTGALVLILAGVAWYLFKT